MNLSRKTIFQQICIMLIIRKKRDQESLLQGDKILGNYLSLSFFNFFLDCVQIVFYISNQKVMQY